MKYTIEGLQQNILNEWKLDCADAVIIRFIVDFYHSEQMKKVEINNTHFFWIHYKTVLEELPILSINKEALATRFKKYVMCGLMRFHLEKTSQGTYTYYNFVENMYEKLVRSGRPTQGQTVTPTQGQTVTKYTSTKDNHSTISLSKDKDKAILGKSPSFKTDPFVEGWNSLKEKFPMLQEHRKPSTKIYQNAVKLIRHLKFGTFGDMCHVDHDFRERNHISQKLLSKKWTETEIKQTINKLPLLFLKGYWPHDKSTLPKDLSSLIFNPRTNSSFFLLVYTHPPVPMKQGKSDTQIDNEIQHSVKKNKPISIEEFLENDEMSSILK
jgi:hypothetical protein